MNRRDMIKKTVLAMPAIVTLKIGKDAMGNQGSNGPPRVQVATQPDKKGHRWWHCLFGWLK